MKKQILYIVGLPGCGKTTLMRSAFSGEPFFVETQPFHHAIYKGGAEIGKTRDGFGGTDALSMAVQPKVVEWMQRTSHYAIVSEGDRLANMKFFNAVRDQGWDVHVIYLNASQETLRHRRLQRGSKQTEAWLKGRETKLERLLTELYGNGFTVTNYDAELPAESLTKQFRNHPIMKRILYDTPTN